LSSGARSTFDFKDTRFDSWCALLLLLSEKKFLISDSKLGNEPVFRVIGSPPIKFGFIRNIRRSREVSGTNKRIIWHLSLSSMDVVKGD
jgi:hypothetical protein